MINFQIDLSVQFLTTFARLLDADEQQESSKTGGKVPKKDWGQNGG